MADDATIERTLATFELGEQLFELFRETLNRFVDDYAHPADDRAREQSLDVDVPGSIVAWMRAAADEIEMANGGGL